MLESPLSGLLRETCSNGGMTVVLVSVALFVRRGDFCSCQWRLCVLCGGKSLNTEVTEVLRALRVEALGATERVQEVRSPTAFPRAPKFHPSAPKFHCQFPGAALIVILAFRRSIRSRGGLAASPSNP